MLLESVLTNFEFRIMFICAYVNLYHGDNIIILIKVNDDEILPKTQKNI